MDDVFRLLHHLRFGNPQGGFGYGGGEIVDFNAVKLPDRHANGIRNAKAHGNLSLRDLGLFLFRVGRAGIQQLANNVILQFTERNICLRQKVSTAACGVKKLEGRELFLKGEQTLLKRSDFSDRLNLFQLRAQIVQK